MKMPNKKNIEDILPLTPIQEGMLFHYLKDPGTDYYFEQLCLTITGEIDLTRFSQAWALVVETNELLRTTFKWEKMKKPLQLVLKEYPLPFIFHDFSNGNKNENDKRNLVQEIKQNDRKNKFNLNSVPFRITLCKLGQAEYEMIISNHHILYDGWSNGILLKEFFSFYHHLAQKKSPLKPHKHKFKEYISRVQGRDVQKQREYWTRYLKGYETRPELSIKRRKAKNINTAAPGNSHYNVKFSQNLGEELGTFIKNHKITLAALLYSAWGILLQRYNHSEDVIFGTTVSGRSADVKGIEDMVGLFINTVPLRVCTHSSGHEKIKDFLSRINQELRERETYENASLLEIKEYGQVVFENELFDTIVVIENYPLDKMLLPGNNPLPLAVDSYSMLETTHYDLTVGITLIEDIEVEFTYNEDLFDESIIKGLSRHFMKIAAEMVDNPGKELAALEILSEAEKNKILFEFNDTAAAYPKENSLHGLFAQQVERTPDNIAAIAPAQVKYRSYRTYMAYISYRELNNQSDRLAWILTGKGVSADTIVGIAAERSIEMIIGILGILKAGGAYLPIDPDYPEERKKYMLKDSNAKILLTMQEIAGPSWPQALYLSAGHHPGFPTSLPASLAYVIYTSGSTGKPKGVLVRHEGVTNAIYWRKNEYRLQENDNVLQLFSFAFDGFVTSFFTPVTSGSCTVFLADNESKDIFAIKKTIVSLGITHFISVPPLYRSLLELCSPGDLPTLRIITLAGEAVDPGLLEKSRQSNPHLKIMIEYGPTENTVVATIYKDAHPGTAILIGKPVANTKIYILDQNEHLAPIGVSGEINITGIGTARGYLNKPGLTFEKFCLRRPGTFLKKGSRTSKNFLLNMLPGKDRFTFQGSPGFHKSYIIYKTGDLARWQPDGNIEFLGRMDFQVKVRGFRIELGEIENELMKHPDVKEAIVTANKDSAGEVRLCAYIVGGVDPDELPAYLAGILPGYMTPAYFEKIEAVPLTAAGKVNRSALPAHKIKTRQEYTAPGNDIEKTLVNTWAEILKLDKKKIGIHDSFFQLGGHSLKATILAAQIHKVFDVKVPLTEIFARPRISRLAQYIKGMVKDDYVSIEPRERKEYYLLSSAQKRMYVEQHMQIESKIYNVSTLIIIEGETNDERLSDTFRQLIKRHESLRTSFVTLQEEAVQIIHEHADFTIEYLGNEGKNAQEIAANFWTPFDLSKAPLLKAGLIKQSEIKHILVVQMHHITADGISNQILMREFRRLSNGENLLPLRIQYKDFSAWQTRLFASPAIKNQEKYWTKQFIADIPVLDLPTDYPRPPAPLSHDAHSLTFLIDKELTARINEVLLETGTTMFMFLLAVFNILLSKYAGQADIVVGCPVSGRKHHDLQNIVGMFVNMLAIRSQVKSSQTFKKFLETVKKNVLDSYENQDYQYDELINALSLQGDTSRNPLFDVVLHMFNLEIPQEDKKDKQMIKFVPYENENMIEIPFDFILNVFERDEQIHLETRYVTALYKKKRIQMMERHFLEIIVKVLEDKNIMLKNLLLSHSLTSAKIMTPLDEEGDFLFQA